ncbi:acyl-CoA dehydrogenase family protein [Crossiella cryophila]|uniref:Alkylation response protein AidB-like acyl-CoA dehydrogenase n=1 Tax=Crossiella cryophila TaxID=43355 RepID=A0A7W7FXV1_9PSEU|nr:acyl-CoA dehydrogenase family protein [Crossiella cryophila]MBB4681038.1 alkylation response protein AidB-like acyl-CoA dehydrogenase [Crossiella cryophila]
MRFALTPEQSQFAKTLHAALESTKDPWPTLVTLGVPALLIPVEHGGLGADPIDLVVAMEELGHHAVPGPLADTLAALPTLLTDLEQPELLTELATGTQASLVMPPHTPLALTASRYFHLDQNTLTTATPAPRPSPNSVAPRTPLSSVDPERQLHHLTPTTPLAQGPVVRAAAARAFNLATLATAAQLLGAARAMLDLTVAHAKARTQFGHPVGAFQAVQHRLADAHVALELARPLTHAAALTRTARDVSAARVAAADAAQRTARTALQLHGAIGYTREYPLSRWLTLVRALHTSWGTQDHHRGRVMAALTEDSWTWD